MRYGIWSVLILTLAMLSVTSLNAQHIGFGPKIGGNYSLMKYKEVAENYKLDHKIGFMGGVFVECGIGKHFAIQPEVLYSQTGMKVMGSNSTSGFAHDRTEALNYLNVPLLFMYRLSGLGLYAGPQLDYLLSAISKEQAYGSGNTHDDIKNHFQKNSFSVVAGISYTLPFGLGFGLRYQRGLKNIAIPDGSTWFGNTQEVFNDLVQANIHFRFSKPASK